MPKKPRGPPICDKLGVLVYSFNFERGLSKDKLAMKKEYLKPENCPRAFNVVIVCITESV